jgi:hypothetical protein
MVKQPANRSPIDVALSDYTFSEVQLTQRQQHLLYDASVHQADFLVTSKRREHFY